jgi:Rrf2 family nitric oxide-sensitive transcriptional repressor
MRLTLHTDYSLRVLIFLAAKNGAIATIPEITEAYGISRGHVMKVVHELARLGYVSTTRGRNGGLQLGKAKEAIRIGDVVRETEELAMVECFSTAETRVTCKIDGACRLKGVLAEALNAFLAVLDGYTLADLVVDRGAPLRRLLQLV